MRRAAPSRPAAALLVRPFLVSGVARIALIADVAGAHLGLWELLAAETEKT